MIKTIEMGPFDLSLKPDAPEIGLPFRDMGTGKNMYSSLVI